MQLNNNLRKWQYVSFGLIAVISLLIFYPSFSHMARADHLLYLTETARIEGWTSLAIKRYAWTRTSTMDPGDELAFRPAFYFLLGTEKWLFGYNFMCWQITGFMLHLAALWWLLKLLLNIRISVFAPLLTLLFSVLTISMEAVIWHHMNSYPLFTTLTFIALYNLLLYTREGMKQGWRIWVMTGCFLINAFLYETGGILSLFFALYLLISHKSHKMPDGAKASRLQGHRWSALMLLLPLVLSMALSALDLYLKGIKPPEASAMSYKFGVWATAKNLIFLITWWINAGVFPSLAGFFVSYRLNAKLFTWTDVLTTENMLTPAAFTGLALIALCLLVFIKSLSVKHLKERWRFLGLLTCLILAYTGVIAVGRINVRGYEYITYNLYWSYIFWGIFIVLIYAFVDFEKLKNNKGMGLAMAVLVAVLIFINGSHSWKVNMEMDRHFKKSSLLIRNIESFIKAHKHEPDFSMAIDLNAPGNFFIVNAKENTRTTLVEMLYPQYAWNSNAKYLWLSDGHFKSRGSPDNQ